MKTVFEVFATVPVLGRIKHIISAGSVAEATARVRRAHPKAASVRAVRLKRK